MTAVCQVTRKLPKLYPSKGASSKRTKKSQNDSEDEMIAPIAPNAISVKNEIETDEEQRLIKVAYCADETYHIVWCSSARIGSFPPISYSIGVWEPQRFLWLFVMFAHFPARLFYPLLYKRLFCVLNSERSKSTWFRVLLFVLTRTLIVETLALLFVTIVDMRTNFSEFDLLLLINSISLLVYFVFVSARILHQADRFFTSILRRIFSIFAIKPPQFLVPTVRLLLYRVK
ncbi:hypothetical protein Tcan_16386 [Toxocara canis]|uniref:CWH43-like N-terminal domain-containing protein n=1 Tax=Toxocara canis TaxID=6265 RepID=A0A0B2VHQ8_TOXCA|nr:hypothetical protein Tcan_16386 [Toxocara canis]